MESVLKLTGDFNTATYKEKRKNQMKALKSLILVLSEYGTDDSTIQNYQVKIFSLHQEKWIFHLYMCIKCFASNIS